jgi:putative colanic acid biosynthesis UDP-glucose lipid carrier transferase
MDDAFAAQVAGYGDRHLVRPGLTGLAQVKGYRGPTPTQSSIQSRIACDRIYIRSWTVAADLRILAKTPFRLFSDKAF